MDEISTTGRQVAASRMHKSKEEGGPIYTILNMSKERGRPYLSDGLVLIDQKQT